MARDIGTKLNKLKNLSRLSPVVVGFPRWGMQNVGGRQQRNR